MSEKGEIEGEGGGGGGWRGKYVIRGGGGDSDGAGLVGVLELQIDVGGALGGCSQVLSACEILHAEPIGKKGLERWLVFFFFFFDVKKRRKKNGGTGCSNRPKLASVR